MLTRAGFGVKREIATFNVVFFVVLVSSVIQGPSINWMAARLGIGGRAVRKGMEGVAEPLAEPASEA